MDDQITLSHMPAPVLDAVMKDVDLKTVQSVRKVCKNLRFHIDGIQLDAKIKKAFVYVAASDKISIELKTADTLFEITYRQNGQNCVIDHVEKKTVENQDIGTCVGNDMGLILKNQKSIIKEISFILSGCKESILENFLNTLSSYLEKRRTKLQLKYFSWNGAIDQGQILRVLEHMDPTTINKIDLTNSKDFGCNPPKMYDIDRIANCQQWRRAKEVETLGFVALTPFENFSKFWKAHFVIDAINTDELLVIRQNALQNAKFQEFSCVYNTFNDESQFFLKIGKPYEVNKKINIWYYKFPMNENALMVSWDPKKRIRFVRIESKNFKRNGVPKDNLIEL